MTGLKPYAILSTIALLFAGCIADEEPIAPYNRGNAEQGVVEMGGDYRYQVFFDLETNSAVKSSLITDWDLGFRCDPEGDHIVLNESKIMSAADLGPVDFASVTSSTGLSWSYDRPSGEWDSTAIGMWWEEGEKPRASKGHVYVIDRGFGANGKTIGFAKMTILSATPTAYKVRIAKMNNADDQVIEIPRDTTRNIMGLSFDNGGKVVDVEPPKDSWDLLFTRYTYIFYDPVFTPYSVTGILINRYRTGAATDTSRPFEEVSSDLAESYTYSTKLDAVGYDWKSYDLNQGIYTVHSPVYILRDSKGFYYKFHLLDFYNDSGEKGYPKIESQKL